MQATKWPCYENSWAGRFSCNNCNPFEGDQLCNKSLPLVCITHAKKLHRPFYEVAVEYTPFAITDGGYYDGWTGGVLQVSVPVRGYDFHWRWANAKQGGWNFWGYFNHHYRGRAWVWVDNQPNGNCGR